MQSGTQQQMSDIEAFVDLQTPEDAQIFLELTHRLAPSRRSGGRFYINGETLPTVYVELALNPRSSLSVLGDQRQGIYASFMQVKKEAAKLARKKNPLLSVERWKTHANYSARVVACASSLKHIVPAVVRLVDQTLDQWNSIARIGSLIVHPDGTKHVATSNYVRRGAPFFIRLVEQMCWTIDEVYDSERERSFFKGFVVATWISSSYLSTFNWGNNKYRELLPSDKWQKKGGDFRKFHDMICHLLSDMGDFENLTRRIRDVVGDNNALLWRFVGECDTWKYWKEEVRNLDEGNTEERQHISEKQEFTTHVAEVASQHEEDFQMEEYSHGEPPHAQFNGAQFVPWNAPVESGYSATTAPGWSSVGSHNSSYAESMCSVGLGDSSVSCTSQCCTDDFIERPNITRSQPMVSAYAHEPVAWGSQPIFGRQPIFTTPVQHTPVILSQPMVTSYGQPLAQTAFSQPNYNSQPSAVHSAPMMVDPSWLQAPVGNHVEVTDIYQQNNNLVRSSKEDSYVVGGINGMDIDIAVDDEYSVCSLECCGMELEFGTELNHFLDYHFGETLSRVASFDLTWIQKHVCSLFDEARQSNALVSSTKLLGVKQEFETNFFPPEFQRVKNHVLECIDDIQISGRCV